MRIENDNINIYFNSKATQFSNDFFFSDSITRKKNET